MAFSCLHDLHLHSNLSLCCGDAQMTPAYIAEYAQQAGYDLICLTDHVWSREVPVEDDFYRSQPVEHIRKSLPLPQIGPRFLFGAETDYAGGDRLGLRREDCEALDFVVIPLNHFHFSFIRPKERYDTPEKVAELFTERLEQLLQLDLPWQKVGLAHPTCHLIFSEGDHYDVFRALDETRVLRALEQYAKRGAGFELNAGCFADWESCPDLSLGIYRLAKQAGLRFYCSSDAHSRESLRSVPQVLPAVVQALELTESDRFML